MGGTTNNYAGGGGGLGAGGDIFVYKGGSLTVQSGTLSGGHVLGGAGGTASNGGQPGIGGLAFGSGIFSPALPCGSQCRGIRLVRALPAPGSAGSCRSIRMASAVR